MVTPVVERQAVAHFCHVFEVTKLWACQLIEADRTSVRYRSVRPDDADLLIRLLSLSLAVAGSAICVSCSFCALREYG